MVVDEEVNEERISPYFFGVRYRNTAPTTRDLAPELEVRPRLYYRHERTVTGSPFGE